MIAIGIDPSVTHTGVVVLDKSLVGLSQAIKSKPVKTWQQQAFRENEIARQVSDIVMAYAHMLDVTVFMEDYAIGGGYAKTIIPQVQLGGALRFALAYIGAVIEVRLVSPSAMKKFATGKGNANKVEVATSLMKRFGEDFKGDDDLWDAYGLARMALCSQGHTDGLTKEQIEVVSKVIAPKVKKGRAK